MAGNASSEALEHVHEAKAEFSEVTLTPPHPPRTETPLYEATHKRLIFAEDRPCFGCGVRHSDLQDSARKADPQVNPFGAEMMESHHFPVERSLATAIDRERVAADYPTVRQFKTLIEWVDSEYNILILCDQCHRLADHAIHRALWQDVIAEKYAIRDPQTGKRYEFAATEKDATAEEAQDETIVEDVAKALGGTVVQP